MAIVKLKLRRTSDEGFLVILTSTNREFETEGFLSPLPKELESSFNQWQLAYRQIEAVRSCIAPKPGMRLTPKAVTIHSQSEHTLAVKDYLNQWLNSGDGRWQPIRDELIAIASGTRQSLIAQQLHQSGDEIRVIIDAKDIDLRRLPWQEWSLFEQHYPHAEVALSTPTNFDKKQIQWLPSSSKVRILVVVGRSDGINTKDDLEVIQKLEERGAEVVCLMQPNLKNLCESLWDEQGYQIFIFTGHSGSREDGQIGWIELNNKDSLSIEQFKEALREAINKGLQLAIFNSCDGLGLANQLAQLNLPQSIVMREPVPDPVAVDFLKYFFNEFTQNQSLFASVQKARKRLEHYKSDYPGAVWLPTICIASLVEPLTWQKLLGDFPKPTRKISKSKPKLIGGLIVSTLLAAIVISFVRLTQENTSPALTACPQQPSQNKPKGIKELIGYFRCFVDVPDVPQGTWLYGGSTAWAKIREQVDQQIEKKVPGFNLSIAQHPTKPMSSGTGIEMLLQGQLSFSQSSRPIQKGEYEMAATRGVKLKQVPVAIDGIAIVVHPSLNIEGLTIEQVKNIYTGQITNWSQVGGPNLKITPYTSPLGSGGTEYFKEEILARNFGKNVIQVRTPTEALNKVSQSQNNESDRGGIYFASATNLVGQCSVKPLPISRYTERKFIPPYQGSLVPPEKCPAQRNQLNFKAIRNGDYPLSRRLFVVIKQNEPVDEQAGEAYAHLLLTDEGQKLIQEAGFIPIRSF